MKKVILSLVVIITLIGSGLYLWNEISPRPLGNNMELEYIGKRDYGCWYPLCVLDPGSTYYYGTDMSIDELEEHLEIEILDPIWDAPITANGYSYESFQAEKKEQKFTVNYHSNSKTTIQSLNLKKTTKKHILEIDAKNYDLIKASSQ